MVGMQAGKTGTLRGLAFATLLLAGGAPMAQQGATEHRPARKAQVERGRRRGIAAQASAGDRRPACSAGRACMAGLETWTSTVEELPRKAGAHVARAEIARDGKIVLVLNKDGEAPCGSERNALDDAPALFAGVSSEVFPLLGTVVVDSECVDRPGDVRLAPISALSGIIASAME